MTGLDGLAASIRQNPQKALMGAAAVAGVTVLALLHRRTSSAAPDSAATTAGAAAGAANLDSTETENDVQSMLNNFWQQLHPDLPATTPPAVPHPLPHPLPFPLPHPAPGPKPPTPAPHRPVKPTAPKPRKPMPAPHPPASFLIPAGGTLYGAAVHFYGAANAPKMLQALAAKNKIKLSVRGGQTYATVHAGQTIVKA